MANARSFLRTWIIAIAGLAVAVVALNLLVDPYDVFGTPRIAGISRYKPAAKNHAMLAKTYQEARAHPVTVLIGSSSTHIGIDAFAPEWPAGMRPVYNYGIPGGYATSASLRTLQEAVTAGGVKNAVVFLDFQNFFNPQNFFGPNGSSNTLNEDDRRYRTLLDGSPNPHRTLQMANDKFLALMTMGALVDSVTTIISQRRPVVLNLFPDGSSSEADFINAARSDGMHDLFAQKFDYEEERANRLKKIVAGWQGPLPNMDIVAAIVAYAKAHGVKLTLVLSPHHVEALDVYWRVGLWPRVEQLKIELADMTADSGGMVTLWDFMDYSAFTTEAVPAAGDRRTPTSWFWEPTHYKKQLGTVMVQRMFGTDAPPFGVELTPGNVAARNAQVRAQRQSVMCDDTGGQPRAPSRRTLNDTCVRIGPVAVAHGPN